MISKISSLFWDSTYAVQMYVPTRLLNKETGDIKEQEVFIGDLPLMTDRGTPNLWFVMLNLLTEPSE